MNDEKTLDRIKEIIKIGAYAFYLGATLGIFGISYTNWGFWVIGIGTILLVAWGRS